MNLPCPALGRQVVAAAGQAASDSRRPSRKQFRGIEKPSKGPTQPGQTPGTLPSSSPVACNSFAFADAGLHVLERNEFRRGVGLCVVNREGKVFAARRVDDRMNTWQMPQGGIDPLENPLVAALRELREETGMTSVRLVTSLDQWLEYEHPTKVKIPGHMEGQWVRYRGQTQKWLLLQFFGHDKEIDIDIECHGPPEFSEWKWMPLEDLPASVVEFKRGVYSSVERHFLPHIHRLVHGNTGLRN